MNDITGDDTENSDGKNDKEKAGDPAGKEFFAFFHLLGITAAGHDHDSGDDHDNKSNETDDTSQETEESGGEAFGVVGDTAESSVDTARATAFGVNFQSATLDGAGKGATTSAVFEGGTLRLVAAAVAGRSAVGSSDTA